MSLFMTFPVAERRLRMAGASMETVVRDWGFFNFRWLAGALWLQRWGPVCHTGGNGRESPSSICIPFHLP
jgi:hypothetical protein